MRKNSEEIKRYNSSYIKVLKKKGVNITGPLVADTVFVDNYKNFNVIGWNVS